MKNFSKTPTVSTDNCLDCPSCGENYLHLEGVRVFGRKEDEETTQVTLVKTEGQYPPKTAAKESASVDNPSDRRDGTQMIFFCEVCSIKYVLNFAQHKGYTYCYWTKKSEEN